VTALAAGTTAVDTSAEINETKIVFLNMILLIVK
jgi:hypothetical protein